MWHITLIAFWGISPLGGYFHGHRAQTRFAFLSIPVILAHFQFMPSHLLRSCNNSSSTSVYTPRGSWLQTSYLLRRLSVNLLFSAMFITFFIFKTYLECRGSGGRCTARLSCRALRSNSRLASNCILPVSHSPYQSE